MHLHTTPKASACEIKVICEILNLMMSALNYYFLDSPPPPYLFIYLFKQLVDRWDTKYY